MSSTSSIDRSAVKSGRVGRSDGEARRAGPACARSAPERPAVLDCRERHEPGAVRVLPGHGPRELDGEARLPDASGTDERQQPRPVEEAAELVQGVVAAHEAGQSLLEIARGRVPPGAGEVGRQPVDHQLDEGFGPRQVLEHVVAQVPRRDAAGQLVSTSWYVAFDSRIWLPCPTAAMRAARFTSKPP